MIRARGRAKHISKAQKDRYIDMLKSTIVGNWKMNGSLETAKALCGDIRGRLGGENGVQTVICPPFVYLETASRALKGSKIAVGAQNVHPDTHGAYTGEISPEMAREFADYVIVGHSERREAFGETDDFIRRKAAAARRAGLKPILCVGESLDARKAGDADEVVSRQLSAGVADLENPSGLIVAYEPVWAIGTGESASPEIAQSVMSSLRRALASRFGEPAARRTPILYGGSVNADNIADLIRQPDIDGALVGGASLSVETFAPIAERAARA